MDGKVLGLNSDHDQVLFCHDRASGLQAIVAMHDTSKGLTMGGTRMRPYASVEAALHDVLSLSRHMTFKAACAGLPIGGAKGVIIGYPGLKTPDLLTRYARFINQLEGLFVTGQDLSLTQDDVVHLKKTTPFVVGIKEGCFGPSPMAALGVFAGVRAAMKHLAGAKSLSGVTVAIQGVGATGEELCRLVNEDGGSTVVCDVDPARAERMRVLYGSRVVAPDEILGVHADVLSPCATGGVLGAAEIEALQVRAVVGAANNQLREEEEDAKRLKRRGIVYGPDFVVNAGGLIEVYSERGEYSRQAVDAKVRAIGDTLCRILQAADADDVSALEATRKLFLAGYN